MRRFPVFSVLFLVIPFIELWLLIKVGSAIGALATILLLILSGILGMYLLRHQGLCHIGKIPTRYAGGATPCQVLAGRYDDVAGRFAVHYPRFFHRYNRVNLAVAAYALPVRESSC